MTKCNRCFVYLLFGNYITIMAEEIEANTLQDWVNYVLDQGFLAADLAGDLAAVLEGLLSH